MANIRSRVFGPGKVDQPRKGASPAVTKKMVDIFKSSLAKKSAEPRFYISGKGFDTIHIEIHRTGTGAGIAYWLRPDESGIRLVEKAVSVLLSGKDTTADAAAMAELRRLGKRLVYPNRVYTQIEKDPKPLVATLFLDRKAYEESIFTIAADCLAVAFFGE